MPWDWDTYQQEGGTKMPPVIHLWQERWKKFRQKIGLSLVIGILIVLWFASGIYIVSPNQVGVVKRFGKMVRMTLPGPHYHLPYPIETVLKPEVAKVRRQEIGFRTISVGPPAKYRIIPEEALMLTGDENIVSVEFIVQYKIKDPVHYLFNVKDIPKTVKDAAEAAMREIVGESSIDEVLTTGKFRIQQDTKKLLQSVLDKYQAGVSVVAVQLQDVHPPQAVVDAFKDVASAKEDMSKFINEAEAYRNDLLPKAKGQAAEIINQAMAYKETKIKMAQGEMERFLSRLKAYKMAPRITRERMYLETMEEILAKTQEIIVPEKAEKIIIPLTQNNQMLPLSKKEATLNSGGR
ncbi:MAG: FtsH protease activity modulator HflK [Candidatus Desulfofervidaceae bacterium]|nr:FtsH protease activity modulator HflK [Candidatus Desulfofervidaceae bacterium]